MFQTLDNTHGSKSPRSNDSDKASDKAFEGNDSFEATMKHNYIQVFTYTLKHLININWYCFSLFVLLSQLLITKGLNFGLIQ